MTWRSLQGLFFKIQLQDMQNQNILQTDQHRENLREEKSNALDQSAQRALGWVFRKKSYFKRYFKYMLIVLSVLFLEHLMSGYTTFSLVNNFVSGFLAPTSSWYLSITVLLIFELAKSWVVIQFYIEFFNEKEGFNRGLFLGTIMITALSFAGSWYGSHAVIYQNFSPPTLVEADEQEMFFKNEIEAKRESIRFLQANSEGSIKWTVNQQISDLEHQINGLNDELNGRLENREEDNKSIIVRHDKTKRFTRDQVRKIAIGFNLFSLIFLVPILGNFIVTSALDYDKRNGDGNDPIISGNSEEPLEITHKTTESIEKGVKVPTKKISGNSAILNGSEVNGSVKK